jgi:ferritin-like metal-binding protein YciE
MTSLITGHSTTNLMQLQIKSADTLEEITALRTIFEDYLKCIYWSELALSPVFSDMINHISSKDAVRILTQHAVNTRIHADRIEKIFESIGIPPEEKKFEAMDSLIGNLDIILDQTSTGSVRDAALIALIQHIIHCEIASYGTLKSFALTLKEENVVMLLEKNLEEEKDLDHRLSIVAEAYINDEAANKEI